MTRIFTAEEAKERQGRGTKMQYRNVNTWVDYSPTCLFCPEYDYRVKPSDESPSQDRGRIPVGARVKIIEQRGTEPDFRNITGELVEDDRSSVPYKVKFDIPSTEYGVGHAWFCTQNLALLDDTQGHRHSVSDWVTGTPRVGMMSSPHVVGLKAPTRSFGEGSELRDYQREMVRELSARIGLPMHFYTQYSGRADRPSQFETRKQIRERLLNL